MPFTFNFENDEATRILMEDCFAKLCKVPFPLAAANAPTVMHYEDCQPKPTLVFLLNAGIHKSRVNTPSPLRINGISTKKYAWVEVTDYDEGDVEATLFAFNSIGYHAYKAEVFDAQRIYVTWDERIIAAQSSDME